ncbi:MAG: TonB-dependent receptor [Bacteroidota bacterium]
MLFLLLFLPLAVAAAPTPFGDTGKISGRVTDARNGDPLPGVNVVIDGTTQGAQTDIDGYYTILLIRPGTYTLRATFVGFASTVVENVRVQVDKTTRINIELAEEAIEGQEVVIVAERPVVEIDRTTTTAILDAEQLEALPVANINEAIGYQAGVVQSPNGDLHFRGGRSGEVAYLVNGVPINNAFSNTASFDVEQNMVQSLQVISGVFNAEYGQATSGVVNIVTKDVPREWSGNFLGYVGAVASNRSLPFLSRTTAPGQGLAAQAFQTESVSMSEAAAFPNVADLQVSLGGPILTDRLGIQLSGRYFRDESFLVARDLFATDDLSFTQTENGLSPGINSSNDPNAWLITSTGSGDFTSLNDTERISVNGTLAYTEGPFRLSYNAFIQDGTYQPYSHSAKYVPDGINTTSFFNQTHILGGRYSFGDRSFANLSYSYLRDESDSKLYDSPFDERHVAPQFGSQQGSFAFNIGGNDLGQGTSLTETHTIVADYTIQASRIHLMKTGAQVRFHRLNNIGFAIGSQQGFIAQPTDDPFANDTLDIAPFEFSAYIQDKMEFEGLIVNAGLRFDYFNPDYELPIDWVLGSELYVRDPDNPASTNAVCLDESVALSERQASCLFNRRDADPSFQLSPRLGVAFPISATGVMRFSAGLFFQTPPFSLIYTNPEFEVNPASSSSQFGNPELEPERTLSFEVGLQQGLTEALGLELTLFSKDVRNLTGQQIVRTSTGDFAVRFINRDYGTIRGFTFALFQRPRRDQALSWTLDYTLQFAEGTASSPGEAFGREQSGLDPILSLVRLDWDRRHSLNATATYAPSDLYSVSLVNRLLSGTPYTTERNQARSIRKNNDEKPIQLFTDLRVYVRPPFVQQDVQLFAEVRNLFDFQVENTVYEDTGTAEATAQQSRLEQTNTSPGGLNTLDEWFFRQDWYGAPRRVSLGLSFGF